MIKTIRIAIVVINLLIELCFCAEWFQFTADVIVNTNRIPGKHFLKSEIYIILLSPALFRHLGLLQAKTRIKSCQDKGFTGI